MAYVYSTLTSDQEYCLYPSDMDAKSIPKHDRSIKINGLCNVINKHTLVTIKGAMTEVSDEELKILEKIPAFTRHKKLGFIKAESKVTMKKIDPETMAESMTAKDRSAQLTNDDFEPDKAPKVNSNG